jgi:hypothetical protein
MDVFVKLCGLIAIVFLSDQLLLISQSTLMQGCCWS